MLFCVPGLKLHQMLTTLRISEQLATNTGKQPSEQMKEDVLHHASWEDSRCSKGERMMKVKGSRDMLLMQRVISISLG
jgi:hypothetical protein